MGADWRYHRRIQVNTIAAVPTRYAGVQFRSRLEARWAVFFDLIDWRWEYEPLDLDGYIPDFIISFESRPLLVEVKPATHREDLTEAMRTIETRAIEWLSPDRNPWPGLDARFAHLNSEEFDHDAWNRWCTRTRDALVVGANWQCGILDDSCAEEAIGAVSDFGYSGRAWSDAQIRSCAGHGWTLTSCSGLWSCFRERPTGDTRGPVCGQPGRDSGVMDSTLRTYWREAGNRVQWWRAPGGTR
jgi:hypothetical protein